MAHDLARMIQSWRSDFAVCEQVSLVDIEARGSWDQRVRCPMHFIRGDVMSNEQSVQGPVQAKKKMMVKGLLASLAAIATIGSANAAYATYYVDY